MLTAGARTPLGPKLNTNTISKLEKYYVHTMHGMEVNYNRENKFVRETDVEILITSTSIKYVLGNKWNF